jgi:hypothetical protein
MSLKKTLLVFLTEVFGPSRPLQLTRVNVERKKNVCMYSCCAMLYVVLAMMSISVIYKFLSLGL